VPLTRISIDVADSSLLLLLFLRSLSTLSACHIINIRVGHQDMNLMIDWTHIIHVLGYITPKFLHISLMIMAVLAIFQEWIWLEVGVAKLLFKC
jgi:hypothetical protein